MNWNPFAWLKSFLTYTGAGSAKYQNLEILKHYPDTCDMQLDDRSLKTLNTLNPRVKGAFAAFTLAAKREAAKLGCDYIAINGTRTWEQQAALYAKGRTTPGPKVTNAKPGSSWHNFGVAVDFGVFQGKKYLDDTDPKLAAKVHAAAAALAPSFDLEWGGGWKTFKDTPHYQKVPFGMTLALARKLHQEGKPVA